MAENLRHWGIETRLMEQQAQVMPGVLEADMAGLVAEALADCGVKVALSEEVVGFDKRPPPHTARIWSS